VKQLFSDTILLDMSNYCFTWNILIN